LYDSKGRERLESKADLASRGIESPDRADSIIGAIMMRLGSDPFAFDPAGRQAMHEMMEQQLRQMQRYNSLFREPFIDWNRSHW
jgi:hypothetical protein